MSQYNNNTQGNQSSGGVFINNCTFTGYLTRDTDSKTSPRDQKTKIATNRMSFGKDQFMNIEMWVNPDQSSGMHDFMMDHCKKGRKVTVIGRMHINEYQKTIQDANGNRVPAVDQAGNAVMITQPVLRINMIDGGNFYNSEDRQEGNQNQQQSNQKQQATQSEPAPVFAAQKNQQGGLSVPSNFSDFGVPADFSFPNNGNQG